MKNPWDDESEETLVIERRHSNQRPLKKKAGPDPTVRASMPKKQYDITSPIHVRPNVLQAKEAIEDTFENSPTNSEKFLSI